MSGHWRVTAFLLLTGLSTSSALSNPLTDLFDPAPKEAPAPAVANEAPVVAKEACRAQPGGSAAPGQHWFYHLEGHRKCWFQRAEATTVSAKKPVHHFAARRPVVAPEENDAPHNRTVMDARDQLLSAAPADTVRPSAPVAEAAPAPAVADKPAVAANEAATPVPAAPVAAPTTFDRPAAGPATSGSVDVEALLAASSLDAVASSKPPAPAAAPSAPNPNHQASMVTQAGTVLIALGLVFLIATLLARRFLYSGVAPLRRA